MAGSRLQERFLLRPDAAGTLRLDRRHVYILPNRNGLAFAAILLAMLVGAVNYGNSMAYALTFLLGSMSLVAILHTYRNLAGLRLRPGRIEPVYAGQTARFHLCLEGEGGRERAAIALVADGQPPVSGDLLPGRPTCLAVALPAPRRGRLRLGRLRIYSEYPLGLFRTWSWLAPGLECLVYPAPEAASPPPPTSGRNGPEGGSAAAGEEDFSGLRDYRVGESLRHVAWKVVAQGRGMYTKQFDGGRAGGLLWLDWEAAAGLDPEARLSRLCRWVLDAETAGAAYGLRLPGLEIEPGAGDAHKRRCLEALALF